MAASKEWYKGATKIIGIGRNYAKHAQELGNEAPLFPFWFMKPTTALIPSGTPHHCPPGKDETHHEVELGVVIGERACRVSPERAMDHVQGYFLALDMTDRIAQTFAKDEGLPWTICKGWDTSCPVSEMVPKERVPDYTSLHLWLKVNNEPKPRQYGSPKDMVFTVPELISAVSAYHTLEPGDLLLTGTPEGVGPVSAGDVITAGIEELGIEMTVPIVDAPMLKG